MAKRRYAGSARKAFADERIQDDTHETFGDPDDTLSAFRAMLHEDEYSSSPKQPADSPQIPSGKDPPESQDIADEHAVRKFLHQSAKFDKAIVDSIIEGGVTKLTIFECLTVEGLLRWRTPNRHGQVPYRSGCANVELKCHIRM